LRDKKATPAHYPRQAAHNRSPVPAKTSKYPKKMKSFVLLLFIACATPVSPDAASAVFGSVPFGTRKLDKNVSATASFTRRCVPLRRDEFPLTE
jgi:hypothetical protein